MPCVLPLNIHPKQVAKHILPLTLRLAALKMMSSCVFAIRVVVFLCKVSLCIHVFDLNRVWDYSYTTVPRLEQEEHGLFGAESRLQVQHAIGGPMAGLGFGLPMSRTYGTFPISCLAKYFGGSLEFRSVMGHGTDFFVRFPNMSKIQQFEI